MAAGPCTIRLTQQGVPGARRAFVSPIRLSDPRASVIVTLFSALRGPCVRFRSDGLSRPSRRSRHRIRCGASGLLALSGQPALPGQYSMCPNPYAS
ncbi:hypothetical protein ADL35_08970 [Streptomyces sp. NRRL WC-3753]|nr:hypothetical protein ADL35_08970 [Streptomyces sp. NRRL WC-3753]